MHDMKVESENSAELTLNNTGRPSMVFGRAEVFFSETSVSQNCENSNERMGAVNVLRGAPRALPSVPKPAERC
jgi:hypothetical protein